MPAIRDFSQAYHSTNTLKSLLVPMPAYVEGDLLLAVMSADTGTQTWTGLGPITSAQYSDNESFTDYTAAANNQTTADIQYLPATPVANEDGFYVGSDVPFAGAYFNFSTQGAGTWTITWQYWNGAWTNLSGVSDGTSNFRAATTTTVATTWTMPTDWTTTSKNGITAYYVRGWLTSYTSKTVNPVGSTIHVTRLVNPWRQLFSATNGANLGLLYKTAEATEVDTTFFYSSAETANGSIITIRDVDGIKDTGWAGNTIAVDASDRTFTRSAGSFVTEGFVAGMTIVTTGFTNGGNNTRKVIETVATLVITVTSDTGLVDESGSGDERIVSSPFNGSVGYATSTTALSKASMPTITTVEDDCLLLYLASSSSVGVPSIIEGAATQVFGKDGSAHSDSCSWGMLRTKGTSPSTVGFSTMAASPSTQLATVALNPPAAGALAAPGHCVSDSSVYLTPFTGAAFNGDAAPADTVTTDFGTVLNGRTLGGANVATSITQGDTGVNSYHAMARLVGLTVAGNYYGLVMRFASGNKPNVSGKNILVHIQPYLPIDIQTTDSVALSGAMGVTLGLCSTANTDYKWWHIGGAGTTWGTARHVPVIVHPDNADYIQGAGTLDDTSIYSIGYAVSGRNVVPDWLFGSMWALDTTVVAGGTTAEPLGIPGIVSACATGHERKSVLLQGSSQMLVMQPIQLGDGGTSKLILDLSATAIEFPKLYSKATKEVSYNSIANEAGITYYAGADDVVVHSNAVISSASKFHWKVHSSSSTGADYDFSGLQIIGAGAVQLRVGVTFDGLVFSSCDEVSAIGATIDNCVFRGTTGTGALAVASAAEMDEVTHCTFEGNAYGIRLTSASAATYTFHGITFSGNTKDIYVAATTGTVTINVEGNGTPAPTYTSAGATVVIVNSVGISVHCVTGLGADIQDVRVAVFKTSDMTELMNSLTSSGGIAATTFNYSTDTAVVIRARKSGAAPKYLPAEASGTILAGGLSVVLTLLADPNA